MATRKSAPKIKANRMSFVMADLDYYIKEHTKKSLPDLRPHASREGELHPSSYPFCPLKYGFNILIGKKHEPLDFYGHYYTGLGTFKHELMQRYLGRGQKILGDWKCLKCGYVKKFATYAPCKKCGHDEVQYDELEIRYRKYTVGHVDGVVQINGKWYVIDYKTTSSKNNALHRTKGKYPYKHNKAQIESYCYYLEKQYDIEIAGWILIYVSRDSSFRDYVMVGEEVSKEYKKELGKKLKIYDKSFGIAEKLKKARDMRYVHELIKYKSCKDKKDYTENFKDEYNECPLAVGGVCFNSEKLVQKMEATVKNKRVFYSV